VFERLTVAQAPGVAAVGGWSHCRHTDFEYGEWQYKAEDRFGHQWTFTPTLNDVAPEEWGGEMVAP
jgi:hypothetical protein